MPYNRNCAKIYACVNHIINVPHKYITHLKTKKSYYEEILYTKINSTKEWLIYFKIQSRVFENVSMREVRKNSNRQINK